MTSTDELNTIWMRITASQVETILGFADEVQRIEFPAAPGYTDVSLGALCIADSSATGWLAVVDRYQPRLRGDAVNLRRLCEILAAGPKSQRLLAGKIRTLAAREGMDSRSWPGEKRTPGPPRSIDDVARAWKDGRKLHSGNISTDGETIYSWRLPIGVTVDGVKVAYDYRGSVSGSTSRHCGAVIRVADRVDEPEAGR